MYSKTEDLFHLCVFILILKQCQSAQTFCGDTEFVFKEKDTKRNVEELGQENVSDLYRCLYLCYLTPTCNSIQFKDNTGLCIMHSLSLEGLPGSDETPELGNQIFYRPNAGAIGSSCTADSDCVLSLSVCNLGTCACDTDYTYKTNNNACLRVYESSCTTNSQCTVPQSECFKGMCKCTPGYSFNPREHSCVHPCETYGNAMTLYAGHAIKEHNEEIYSSTSPQGCFDKCLAETGFICTTFDYLSSNSECQLSTTSYLEAPPQDLFADMNGFFHGIRQCA